MLYIFTILYFYSFYLYLWEIFYVPSLYMCRITESLGLENASKIIWSNHHPTANVTH